MTHCRPSRARLRAAPAAVMCGPDVLAPTCGSNSAWRTSLAGRGPAPPEDRVTTRGVQLVSQVFQREQTRGVDFCNEDCKPNVYPGEGRRENCQNRGALHGGCDMRFGLPGGATGLPAHSGGESVLDKKTHPAILPCPCPFWQLGLSLTRFGGHPVFTGARYVAYPTPKLSRH